MIKPDPRWILKKGFHRSMLKTDIKSSFRERRLALLCIGIDWSRSHCLRVVTSQIAYRLPITKRWEDWSSLTKCMASGEAASWSGTIDCDACLRLHIHWLPVSRFFNSGSTGATGVQGNVSYVEAQYNGFIVTCVPGLLSYYTWRRYMLYASDIIFSGGSSTAAHAFESEHVWYLKKQYFWHAAHIDMRHIQFANFHTVLCIMGFQLKYANFVRT